MILCPAFILAEACYLCCMIYGLYGQFGAQCIALGNCSQLGLTALVDLAERVKICLRFQAERSCRWDVLQWMRWAVLCCCPCSAFGGWADIIGLVLSAQCEAQEEKLLNDVWEWWLRVNSQFGNVNVTSIINNPTVEERKNAANRAVSQGSGRQN